MSNDPSPATRPQDNDSTSPESSDEPLFILASASPRRRKLLALLELPFIVVLPEDAPSTPPISTRLTGRADTPINQGGIDETPLPGESPTALVQRLSRAKARAVAARLPSLNLPDPATRDRGVIIIAADTEVASGEEILGKPASPAEATDMLKRLRREQWHYVYSGLTVARWSAPESREMAPSTAGQAGLSTDASLPDMITRLHQSKVWMRAYSDAEIGAYVASGDPLDKAGAYAIQHKTFAPVERLEGCFASVMGLPLGELAAALAELGLSPPEVAPRCNRYSAYPCCQQTAGAGRRDPKGFHD